MTTETEQVSSDKPSNSTNEESAKQPIASTEYTDTVTPYVSHITQMMAGLLDSKLKLSQKTSITKESLQEHYLVNTYFQILVNELLSLKES